MSDTKYPEHEKLHLIAKQSQLVYDFMEWLSHEKGIHRAVYGSDKYGDLWIDNTPIRDLLAEFFEINQDRLETEKRQMLEDIRAMQDSLGAKENA